MKGMVAALVLAVSLTGGVAGGADSPVIVWHEVIGLDKGAGKMIVRYLLHVVNGSDGALSGLTLAVVPSPPFLTARTAVAVDTLAPNQGAELPLQLEVPASLAEELIRRQPLFLGGRCVNSEGKIIDFPAQSFAGGAE